MSQDLSHALEELLKKWIIGGKKTKINIHILMESQDMAYKNIRGL